MPAWVHAQLSRLWPGTPTWPCVSTASGAPQVMLLTLCQCSLSSMMPAWLHAEPSSFQRASGASSVICHTISRTYSVRRTSCPAALLSVLMPIPGHAVAAQAPHLRCCSHLQPADRSQAAMRAAGPMGEAFTQQGTWRATAVLGLQACVLSPNHSNACMLQDPWGRASGSRASGDSLQHWLSAVTKSEHDSARLSSTQLSSYAGALIACHTAAGCIILSDCAGPTGEGFTQQSTRRVAAALALRWPGVRLRYLVDVDATADHVIQLTRALAEQPHYKQVSPVGCALVGPQQARSKRSWRVYCRRERLHANIIAWCMHVPSQDCWAQRA